MVSGAEFVANGVKSKAGDVVLHSSPATTAHWQGFPVLHLKAVIAISSSYQFFGTRDIHYYGAMDPLK